MANRSACDDKRMEIDALIDDLDFDDVLTAPLRSHLRREYGTGGKRKFCATLDNAYKALQVLNVKVEMAEQEKKEDITMFKEKIEWIKYFDQPAIKDTNGASASGKYNTRSSFYLESLPSNHLYQYEFGSCSGAWGLFAPRKYIMRDDIFELCQHLMRGPEDGGTGPLGHQELRKYMQKMEKSMGRTFLMEQEGRDQTIIGEAFVKLGKDDPQTLADIQHAFMSGGVLWDATWTRAVERNADFDPFSQRRLRDAMNEHYINNIYTSYDINPEAKDWSSLIDTSNKYMDFVKEQYQELKTSCMAKLIIHTYKKSFDKYMIKCKSSKMLDMYLLSRICFGVKWDGKSEVSMTMVDVQKFLDMYRKKKTLGNPGLRHQQQPHL